MKDYTIYVTEKIAKKAMEKGLECQRVYEDRPLGPSHNEFLAKDPLSSTISILIYKCPTAEQICGWLRAEYGIVISIVYFFNRNTWQFEENIVKWAIAYPRKESDEFLGSGISDTYEEALLEAINKALDLI